jgi:hydroxypyruvate isomerase
MFFSAIPDPETLVAAVAEIGFDGIEIWGRDDNFKNWLALPQKYNVPLCNMVGHWAEMIREECHAEAEKQLRESIDIAADNNIGGLICFSGNRVPGQSIEAALDTIVNGFRRVTAYAEEKNVTLQLELLNSRVDHVGYFCDRTEVGVEICRRVGSPRLRLLYDIYHMQIMEGDVIRTIRNNIEWIGHFHTAGNPGRNELNHSQELNYGAIAKAIREIGFTGFVGHEFAPLGDAVSGLREAFSIMQPCAD